MITSIPLRIQKRLTTIGVGANPNGIAVSPNNLVAIVTNEGDDSIAIISIIQEEVIEYIDVGLSPTDVIITSDGKKAYVANSHDNHITVIDVEQKVKLKDIIVGDNPIALALVGK
jgi:YVTN family beta-propeller protein